MAPVSLKRRAFRAAWDKSATPRFRSCRAKSRHPSALTLANRTSAAALRLCRHRRRGSGGGRKGGVELGEPEFGQKLIGAGNLTKGRIGARNVTRNRPRDGQAIGSHPLSGRAVRRCLI